MEVKNWIIGVLVVIAVLAGGRWLIDYVNYSTLNSGKQTAAARLADVAVQEQRRGNLADQTIPALKGGTAQERAIAETWAKARTEMGSIKLSGNPSAEDIKRYADAMNAQSSAFSRFLAVAENYPAIKTSQLFLSYMAQSEGSENRVGVAYLRYNEAVREYNTCIGGYFCAGTARKNGFVAIPPLEVPTKSREVPKPDFTKS